MSKSKQKSEIECPKCGGTFSVTEAIASEVHEELEAQYREKSKELRSEFTEKEKRLKERAEALEKSEEAFDKRLKDELEKQVAVIAKKAEEKAKEATKLEMDDLANQLKEQKKRSEESAKNELQLRERVREVEEKEKSMDLEIQRQVDEQSRKAKAGVQEEYETKIKLLAKDRDHKEEGLKKQIAELTRKLEQGSQQNQGEVQELVLEDELRTSFPMDEIEEVAKGKKGADAIQIVNNSVGLSCGKIIWESKRTKNWSDGWLQKIKDDQREAKADVAVLVTKALPGDIKGFGRKEGVWITDFSHCISLCTVLRTNLVQVTAVRLANVGKNEKMEVIYQYLSGNEFKQRVMGIVEAFQAMKADLEKEKISMTKHWAKREKEIDRVITGTVGMYGDLEGIVGASLPKIEALQLESGQNLISDESKTK